MTSGLWIRYAACPVYTVRSAGNTTLENEICTHPRATSLTSGPYYMEPVYHQPLQAKQTVKPTPVVVVIYEESFFTCSAATEKWPRSANIASVPVMRSQWSSENNFHNNVSKAAIGNLVSNAVTFLLLRLYSTKEVR